MTSPAAGTGRDRPAIKWLAGYALVAAVVIFAGGVWVVLPEKRRLEQVQRQFIAQRSPPRAESRGLCPLSSAQSGEPGRRLSAGGAAILPPPTGDITGAAPAVESNSHRPADAADAAGQRPCQRLAQDPLSLFMTPGHDPPAGLRWRAMSAGGHGDRPGWTVAATTDFAGFERLLSAIAALNGCIGLQALSLKATPEGLMLDFRLTRADESTPAVAKENDDGEMPAGAY
ncbi:hypothetical protein AAH678_02160 [Sodalis endosymbiont of Spalangia cameroni]|uniref:hypothetical protein n=1 Tax=Sodalis praecaptivus TaxID=1239307 RepID=UPI0031F97B03